MQLDDNFPLPGPGDEIKPEMHLSLLQKMGIGITLAVLSFLQSNGITISGVSPGLRPKIAGQKEGVQTAKLVEPEYRDPLNTITIGIDPKLDLLETQLNILKVIPKKTGVNIIVWDKSDISEIEKHLPEDLKDRVEYFSVERRYEVTWPQDISEGKIFPDSALSQYYPDAYAALLPFCCDAIELPVYFEGGNLCIAEVDNRLVVVTGADSFIFHNKLCKTRKEIPPISLDEYKRQLQQGFHCDDVLILGVTDSSGKWLEQPNALFHIDFCMLPIAPNKIVILTPDNLEIPEEPLPSPRYDQYVSASDEIEKLNLDRGANGKPPLSNKECKEIIKQYNRHAIQERACKEIPEIKKFLSTIRKQLKDAGFELIDCVTTVEALMEFQSPLNGILFGENYFIMPIYPDENGLYDHYLNSENKRILEKAGLKVITCLEEKGWEFGGNLHCMTSRLGLGKGTE